MALILAAVMAVSCLTTILLAASKPWTGVGIGELSQYYETGNNADPGRVSNVKGDSGGTSYGLYMFVEGTVTNFINWLKQQPKGSTYYDFGDTLWRAYNFDVNGNENPGYGTNFKTVWQSIGHGKTSNEFGQAQTEFWGSTQYTQLVSNIERLFSGFDIDNYSVALKNVFWSRSVHHGVGVTYGANSDDKMSGATGVIARAFRSLGGFKNQSEAELIAAIYAECSRLDPVGKYKEDNMDTYTAQKYGVYGRSMAYFNVNSGGVQTSVYSRLHVNEPSDALVMRYVNSTPDIAEGKYTLLYINNNEQTHGLDPSQSTLVTADKAVKLQITYYSGEKYTIATTDGSQRLTISGGKPVLASPAADNNQFWVIYGSTSSGYTLQNVGTKQYVTVTVTSADVTADGQSRDDLITAKISEIAQTPADGQTNAAAADFSARLEKKLNNLFEEQFKDKNDEAIMAEIKAKISAMQNITEENKTTLIKKLENLAQSKETEDDLEARIMESFTEDELLLLTEAMTGKSIETVIVEVVGEMVDEDLKNNPTTTVTTYTVGLTDESAKAARWSLNKLGGTDDWTLTGLFYPGCDDSDAIGGTVTHHLTDGNSSFPLRGVISCTKSISSVTVEVKGTSGEPGFTVTGSGKGNWFDLWELDKSATFSSLKQGTYKLTIYGRNASGEVSIWSDSFTVGAKDSSAPAVKDDTYTVTFKNGSNTVTRTYKLGDTYGTLPTASGEGFQGWFTDDGEQIFENSIVAAEDHTITAKFGTLYTVTFKVDGSVYRSRQLAKDSLIVAPSNPFKAADKNYVYSFSHWVDGSGKRFVEGRTYMPAGDVTYTAVFTKTANSGGGTGGETPKPSGNYLTGVSPSTSVSAMNSAGYTIYNGSTKVTSGLVGTGMTAVSSSATVTIVVTGDVSGDGKITITDVVKLQKSVVGSGSLSGAYAKAADINGDGKVTITDVVQAAQVTVGQRTIG